MLLTSLSVILFSLYTAGSDVSVKDEEKKILSKLTETFMFTIYPLPSCMISSSNDI